MITQFISIDEDLRSHAFAVARNRFKDNIEEHYISDDIDLKVKDEVFKILENYEYKTNESYYYNMPNKAVHDIVVAEKQYLIDGEDFIISFKIARTDDGDKIDERITSFWIFGIPSRKLSKLVEKIIAKVKKNLVIAVEDTYFYTIGTSNYGFTLDSNEITNLETYDDEHLEYHYGVDFLDEYKDIKKNLKEKDYGLMLLHGVPGTGKTTLIRQLIKELCPIKKVIYVPSYMIEQVADPKFITFLQSYKKSILILEDAENILKSREDLNYTSQSISNILNITNGLLNDSMNIQIIATFNMDKTRIDSALLRPGRLLNEWQFDKLSIENSKRLVEHLGKDIEVTEEMTVSDIYNYGGYLKVNKKTKKENKIGF